MAAPTMASSARERVDEPLPALTHWVEKALR